MTQPIGYDTDAFTEQELTFLDDVSENQIDDFLEYIETKRFVISKWFFESGPRVLGFEADRFSDVGDYFRYIRSLNERR